MIADNIFFASYGGGHAASLAPVIERLAHQGTDICTMAFTTARAALQRAGIDSIGMADIVHLTPSYIDASTIGATLTVGQPRHPLVSIAETEAYMGVGYLALEREHGAEEAARIWTHSGRQAFLPIDFFEELFTRERPAVVVATNSPRSERAALEAARRLDIPSLCLVDLYAAFEIEWCGAPGYASTICVLNEEVRERFIAHGAAADRVVATGNPAFDRLGRIDYAAVRDRARDRLGLTVHDRLILWVSQPEAALHPFSAIPGDPTLPAQVDRYLAKAFEDDPHIHVALRLHPNEDRAQDVTGARIRYSDRDEPLDDLLCACDCALTFSSTVGVEAALLGVPVVQPMDSIFSADLPLSAMGMAVSVESYKDSAAPIRKILEAVDPTPDDLRVPEGRFDAADRVVQEIAALAA